MTIRCSPRIAKPDGSLIIAKHSIVHLSCLITHDRKVSADVGRRMGLAFAGFNASQRLRSHDIVLLNAKQNSSMGALFRNWCVVLKSRTYQLQRNRRYIVVNSDVSARLRTLLNICIRVFLTITCLILWSMSMAITWFWQNRCVRWLQANSSMVPPIKSNECQRT